MSERDAMLAIKTLDNRACIRFSEWTGQWYVEAKVEVSDGVCLRGGSEHRDSPTAAVYAYLDMLRAVGLDEVIVAYFGDERRHFRWNGYAFAEVPMVAVSG